jgi:hypothetical protein
MARCGGKLDVPAQGCLSPGQFGREPIDGPTQEGIASFRHSKSVKAIALAVEAWPAGEYSRGVERCDCIPVRQVRRLPPTLALPAIENLVHRA